MRLRDVEWEVLITNVTMAGEIEFVATIDGRFVRNWYYNHSWMITHPEFLEMVAPSWTDQVVQRLVDMRLEYLYKKVREEVLA